LGFAFGGRTCGRGSRGHDFIGVSGAKRRNNQACERGGDGSGAAARAGISCPQSDLRPPSDAWVNAYQKGLMHGKAGEYAAAVKSFQQAAQTAPEQPGPQTALATANLKLAENARGSERGKYLEAALEGANRAVALQADSAQARYVQGLALERNGQFADAEMPLQQAVKLTPNDSHAWYALGLALEKQNKTDAARNALEQAVLLDPANTDARLLLASYWRRAARLRQKSRLKF
jgi:Flp pilus assembly protein TadD